MGLSKSILGLKESFLSQWEWILGFGNTFGARYVDVGHLRVNFGPLEVDFRLDGEFTLLGFDFRALKVDYEPRGVGIWSL